MLPRYPRCHKQKAKPPDPKATWKGKDRKDSAQKLGVNPSFLWRPRGAELLKPNLASSLASVLGSEPEHLGFRGFRPEGPNPRLLKEGSQDKALCISTGWLSPGFTRSLSASCVLRRSTLEGAAQCLGAVLLLGVNGGSLKSPQLRGQFNPEGLFRAVIPSFWLLDSSRQDQSAFCLNLPIPTPQAHAQLGTAFALKGA